MKFLCVIRLCAILSKYNVRKITVQKFGIVQILGVFLYKY